MVQQERGRFSPDRRAARHWRAHNKRRIMPREAYRGMRDFDVEGVKAILSRERQPKNLIYTSNGVVEPMLEDLLSSDVGRKIKVDYDRARHLARVGSAEAVRNGAVFEELAYRILHNEAPEGITVVSPKGAHAISKLMFPYAVELQAGMGNLAGLRGDAAFSPDGFLVTMVDDEPVFLASIEYTLRQGREFDSALRDKYRKFTATKRSFKPLKGMSLLVVTPDLGITPEIAEKRDVSIAQFAFSKFNFVQSLEYITRL